MPMPEKKGKKVSFSTEDAVSLTQRYDGTTVLTLLQEISHYPKGKLDWNELVSKTATGISNAREYQMLWRHLAYREALPEIFEEGAQPLDDDSDLDCEVEALPSVSADSASEATASVKVMIASRTLSESTPSSSTIEAPLTIDVPVGRSSRSNQSSQPSSLMGGTSIIFPVTVQRQTLPTASSTDGIETKGLIGGSMASKRKRKAWSEEEDMQLRAAVQRWGEGNWATMAKGDNFPIKRSPTQLAQRWSTLRKRDGSATSGTISTSTQYTTAEQLATRHSLSLALDMPFKKLTAPGMTGPVRTSMSIKNEVKPYNTKEVSTVRTSAPIKSEVNLCNPKEVSTVRGSVPPLHPSQHALLGSCSSPAKSKLASEKLVSNCNSVSDREFKPTTVHSGAQTVSRSNTVSQLKVAQAKNTVDAAPVSSSLAKTSISNTVSLVKVAQAKNTVDAVPVSSSLAKTSISAGLPSDLKVKHVTSVAGEVLLKQEVNPTKEDFRVPNTGFTPKGKIQENQTSNLTPRSQIATKLDKDLGKEKSLPSEKILEHKAVSENPKGCEDQGNVKNSNSLPKTEATANENNNLNKASQNVDQGKGADSINGSSNHQKMDEKHVNLPIQDECSKDLEPPR